MFWRPQMNPLEILGIKVRETNQLDQTAVYFC